MIDTQCNVEFPSDALYLKHKESGHKLYLEKTIPIEAPPIPAPPPGIPKDSMPSPEFIAQVNRMEAEKNKEAAKPSQHPTQLPPSIPIKLTYKYTGECPDHRVAIDTLELDIAKDHFCVAFCSTGKHQIQTKQVVKL